VFPWSTIVPPRAQETNHERSVDQAATTGPWPAAVYDVLKAAKVQQIADVPDAGHKAGDDKWPALMTPKAGR